MCQTVADDSVYGVLMTEAFLCFISSSSLTPQAQSSECNLSGTSVPWRDIFDKLSNDWQISIFWVCDNELSDHVSLKKEKKCILADSNPQLSLVKKIKKYIG